MSSARRMEVRALLRRRYLVHLFGVPDGRCERYRYIAKIRQWALRKAKTENCQRAFVDDRELISTINPLLPQGSDVRDVFEHIEGPNGFIYLLCLTAEEALRLGWRPSGQV